MDRMNSARDADSFYVDDCRQVQTNTQSLQKLTGQITRLVGTLETDKDLSHCRKLVDDAVRLASETQTILKRVQDYGRQATNPSERNNRRMMYTKLSDNLAMTARVLEDVVRRFTEAEKRRMERSAATRISPADAAGGEHNPQLVREEQSLLSTSNEPVDSLDYELQQERCTQLERVGEDMQCLRKIYSDLAVAAEEQQNTMDTIESHMAHASMDIERGRDELIVATNRWDRRLKRRIWIVVGGVVSFLALNAFLHS